jgi:AcrR family transcriptional regulator
MRMARLTRAERRARTRASLLEAARRVFARYGFHGATLDRIADEAGFTKGAVYSNFTSKEELFLALLDAQVVGEAGDVGASPTADEPGTVSAGFPDAALPSDPDAVQWGLLTLEFFLYAVRDPQLRADLAARYERLRGQIAAVPPGSWGAVGAGQAFAPREIATVVLALSTGLGVQAALDRDAIPRDLLARVIARLVGPQPGDA